MNIIHISGLNTVGLYWLKESRLFAETGHSIRRLDAFLVQRAADFPVAEFSFCLVGTNLGCRYNAGATSPLQM